MLSPPVDASKIATAALESLPTNSEADPKLLIPRLIAGNEPLTDTQVSEVRHFFERDQDRSTVQWMTASRLFGGVPMLQAVKKYDEPVPPTLVTAVVALLPPEVTELAGCGMVDLIVVGDSVAVPPTWVTQIIETVKDVAAVWPTAMLTAEWGDTATVFESPELRMIRNAVRTGLTRRDVRFVDEPWHPETVCQTPLLGASCNVASLAVAHDGNLTCFNLDGRTRIAVTPEPSNSQLGTVLAEQLTTIQTRAGLAVSEMVRLAWESALRRVGAVASRMNPDLKQYDRLDAGRRVPAETVEHLNPNVTDLVSKIVSDTTLRIANLTDQLNAAMWDSVFKAIQVEGLAPPVDTTTAIDELTGELVERLTVTKNGSTVPAAPPAGLARRYLTTVFSPECDDHALNATSVGPAGIIAAGLTAATDPTAAGALIDHPPKRTVETGHLSWVASSNTYSSGRTHRHDPARGYELHCNCGFKLSHKNI